MGKVIKETEKKITILDRLFKAMGYAKTVKADTQKKNNVSAEQITGAPIFNYSNGISQQVDYSTLVNNYKYWVYTCIDKLSTYISSLPLELYVYKMGDTKLKGLTIKNDLRQLKNRRERELYLKEKNIEKIKISNHPFLDLINNPNMMMTRFTLWKNIVIRLELAGYCGVYMPPNGLGLPGELWPLPLTSTGSIRVIPDRQNVISGFLYVDGQSRQRLELDEVNYIYYPNPRDPFKGQSALMAQDYPYDIDLYLMQQQYNFLRNKATVGNVFTTESRLMADEVDEIKKQINEQYAGAVNSGKPIIVHSGLKLDNRGLSQTTKDMMLAETEKYAREKLFAAYGVSAGKMGMVDDVNRANLEGLEKAYVKDNVIPKTMLIEEFFEKNTLPKYSEYLTMDFKTPDFSERELDLKERETNLKYGYKTINECRTEEGLEPVPWGDEPWFAFNLVQPSAAGTAGEGEKSHKTKYFPVKMKLLSQGFWTEERKQLYNERFKQHTENMEKPFVTVMDKHFDRQKKETIDRLYKEGNKILGHVNGWSHKKVRMWVKTNKNKIDKINIDVDDEAEILAADSIPVYKSVLKEAGESILAELGVTAEFIVSDPEVEKWLSRRVKKFTKGVEETTYKKLNAILRDGFNEGMPLSKIADNITEAFSGFKTYRSQTIARTETLGANNFAELEAIKQEKLDGTLEKFWIAEVDARDTHARAADVYNESSPIPINENFIVGADEMPAPGNGTKAEENINCRCNLGYVERKK